MINPEVVWGDEGPFHKPEPRQQVNQKELDRWADDGGAPVVDLRTTSINAGRAARKFGLGAVDRSNAQAARIAATNEDTRQVTFGRGVVLSPTRG